jgi:hypothetical protein
VTIPTQMSLHGFIATAPELTFTGKGHARFFCRVGIEQHRLRSTGRSPGSTPSSATWSCSTARPSEPTRGSSRATRSSRPVMPPEVIRTLPFGTALVLLRSAPPLVTDLRPWTERRNADRLRDQRTEVEIALRRR